MSQSSTGVFGIEDYESATDEQLQRLLEHLGRNGQTEQGMKIEKEVNTILEDRKKRGIVIEDKILHHPV